MQLVLSIDVSSEPSRIVVVRMEDKQLEVVEGYTVQTFPLFSREALTSAGIPFTPPKGDQPPVVPAGSAIDTVISYGEAAPLSFEQQVHESLTWFKRAIEGVKNEPSAVIVILPHYEYFSLNMELPFNDQRTLNRVIDFEVQDLVPFDISDLLLEHHPFTPASTNGSANGKAAYDIHVSALPRRIIKNVLDICQHCKIQPSVLTTTSSTVGAAFHLASDYFPDQSAIIYEDKESVAVAMKLGGEVRKDRIISRRPILSDAEMKKVLIEIKLTLASAERSYDRRINQIYLASRELRAASVQQALGREIENFSLTELVKTDNPDLALPALAATFVGENGPAQVLTNFRTREFSFGPQLRNVFEALSGVRNVAIVFLVCVCIALLSTYVTRAYRLRKMRNEIAAHIAQIVPDFQAEPGKENVELNARISALEQKLADLGSRSKITPLDALLQLSKDMILEEGATITDVLIRNNKIELTIVANSWRPADKLEAILQDKDKTYCRVKRENLTQTQGGRNAKIEMILCE